MLRILVVLALCLVSDWQGMAQDPLTNGLVAYYPMNGNGADLSGNGRECVVRQAVPSLDRFGAPNGCYRFNGTDAFLSAPASGLPAGNRTVSVWYKAENGAATGPTLLSYGGNGGTGWVGNSFFMTIFSDCASRGYSVGPHGSGQGFNSTTPFPESNSWTHWVVAVEGGTLKFYVNGRQTAAQDVGFPSTWTAGSDLLVGACVSMAGRGPYTDGCVSFFKGSLDDIRIYNRALSPQEVALLHRVESHQVNTLLVSVRSVQVDMVVVPGNDYQLESSANLLDWSQVGDAFRALSSLATVVVDVSPGQAFLRLVRP